MIDTVRMAVVGKWAKPDRLPGGWSTRESVIVEQDGEERREVASRFLTHQGTGCRVWGGGEGPSWVEASLPRQVFEHNGRLIASQEVLDASVKALHERVGQVVEDLSARQITRLDTVWQFKGDPSQWVGALGASRWKGTRSEPRIFFGESVEWVGSTQVMRVYDKLFEATGRKGGDVVRVEHQAKSKLLNRSGMGLMGFANVERLNFANLYRWYRFNVGTLPAFKVLPPAPLSIAAYLAYLRSRDVRVDGVPAVEVYMRSRSTRTERRIRRQMAASLTRDLLTVDFNELLPEHSLPPVVDLAA